MWLIGVNFNAEVLILTGKGSVFLVGLLRAGRQVCPQMCPLCPLCEERGVRACTTEPQTTMCVIYVILHFFLVFPTSTAQKLRRESWEPQPNESRRF